MKHPVYVTQYNKRYILSNFEKIEIFELSIRRFNKLSNDTKFVKIEVILLKVHYHYLRINLTDKMSMYFYFAIILRWIKNYCLKNNADNPSSRLILIKQGIGMVMAVPRQNGGNKPDLNHKIIPIWLRTRIIKPHHKG